VEIIHHRGGLVRTMRALKSGRITLGFIGGSITDPRSGTRWPEPVTAWFIEHFPGVRVLVENAAIGATSSDLGVFRAERDLIRRGCDLVFIEYAVNDNGVPVENRNRTREGLIRKLLKDEPRDLVFVYTYCQTMYQDMSEQKVPASIAEFEVLGSHYSIGSVWAGLHALREVQQGRMRWEEWLPDGLHPEFRGSLSYGRSVITFLERELLTFANTNTPPGEGTIPFGKNLPRPLNPNHWGDAHTLDWSDVRLDGPWRIRRSCGLVWMDQIASTAAVGAKLSFEFTGRGLLLGFDFGKSSAEFRYRLDGKDWQCSKRDRPPWCGVDGWYRTFSVADDLAPGRHTFELEVVHGNPLDDPALSEGCTGTNFNLALIGIIP
jgi:hypothetical protein